MHSIKCGSCSYNQAPISKFNNSADLDIAGLDSPSPSASSAAGAASSSGLAIFHFTRHNACGQTVRWSIVHWSAAFSDRSGRDIHQRCQGAEASKKNAMRCGEGEGRLICREWNLMPTSSITAVVTIIETMDPADRVIFMRFQSVHHRLN